ncbi:MAG: 30S ribosomal protein S13 [Candidatus Omnitrophica bacterium]|nr:30S ribosomal protein S13 [Candidatus Omnitrophota bacterium]
MPRLLGIDIPKEKRMDIAIRYIYGIGPQLGREVLDEAGIGYERRAKDLTEKEISAITAVIQKNGYKVEGDLRREVQQNIKRLIDIKCYKGNRHLKGLPVRGQRSHTNARTRKGPRKTIGGLKKAAPSAG